MRLLIPLDARCAFRMAVAALLMHSCGSSLAQDQEQHRDSVKYALPEVMVTATRQKCAATLVPSATTIVELDRILLKPGRLLSDALEGMPASFVRAYGGPEAVRTFSLRGMGPENTLVLIDGHRVNDLQNGQVDFGLMHSESVDRIEVVKGGYAALYGADAAGGVVSIFTRPPREMLSLDINGSMGAAGYAAGQVAIDGTIGILGFRGTILKEQSDGDYAFIFNNGVQDITLHRQDADSRLLSGDASVQGTFDENLKLTVRGAFLDADRGSPGPVTRPDEAGKARLEDRGFRTQMSLDWKLSGRSSLWFGSSYRYAFQRYGDPNVLINGEVLESEASNSDLVITPEFRFSASPLFSGTAGAELSYGEATGNQVGDAHRAAAAAYATTQHTLLLPWEEPFEVVLVPSLRWDGNSDFGSAVSPRIGLNFGLLRLPDLRFRTSFGLNFRAPTLNDMYWTTGGNPDLRAERSESFDCGLLVGVSSFGEWKASVDYFSILTRDRIVWTPSEGPYWSPTNAGRVSSTGIEAELTWSDPYRLSVLSVNSTWNGVVKKSRDYPADAAEGKHLPYVPEQTVNASVTMMLGDLQLYAAYNWVSHRFTTESNDHFLPHYSLLSASARYTYPGRAIRPYVKLEGTNLLNTSYQIIALYPMPLREIRATVGVQM